MAKETLFGQIAFARNATLNLVKDLNTKDALIIPQGFSNNILWNLGHIYSSLESFAFAFVGEQLILPESFQGLFGTGSKPADWSGDIPELSELVKMLAEQPKRLEEKLTGKLEQEVTLPFAIPGVELKTLRDLITFSFYHEGGHTQTIKFIKKFINK